MARKPIVAGMFYEAGKEALKEQIKESFLSEFGPGKLPEGKKEKTILGDYPDKKTAITETQKEHQRGTFIVQSCSVEREPMPVCRGAVL